MLTILFVISASFLAGCAVGAKSASTVTADLAKVKADVASIVAAVKAKV